MAYITRQQVRDYKSFKTNDTDNDSLLDDLITRAQVIIDRYCNRTFEASTNTVRYFDAVRDVENNGLLLYLDDDLSEINSVTNGDGIVVASNEYVTEPRNVTPYYAIKILSNSGKAWEYDDDPENAIAVSGKWAYSTTAPLDIQQACIELTAYLFDKRLRLVEDSRGQVSNDGVALMPSDIPRSVRSILDRYKKVL
jgi:hypothetical protein